MTIESSFILTLILTKNKVVISKAETLMPKEIAQSKLGNSYAAIFSLQTVDSNGLSSSKKASQNLQYQANA